MFSEQVIKDKLRLLLWDTPATVEDSYALLIHDRPCKHLSKHNLYQKILTAFPWYTVIRMIPVDKVSHAMSNEVIEGLFPKKLKENYFNARSFILR